MSGGALSFLASDDFECPLLKIKRDTYIVKRDTYIATAVSRIDSPALNSAVIDEAR